MKTGITKNAGAKIGLLSGMGPLAGSDVLHKMLKYAAEEYGAIEDVEYPDVVLLSHGIDGFDAQGTLGPNFVSELVGAANELDAGGPTVIGMACNTAHLCFDDVKRAVGPHVINLPDEVAIQAAKQGGNLLLLCSDTTRKSGLYHAYLKARGVSFRVLAQKEQHLIDEAIGLVMAFKLSDAAAKVAQVIEAHADTVDGFIVGCTELPMAIACLSPQKACIDSNFVLAKALADHCYQISS